MTVNGWLQILLFITAVAAITRPAGRYMALVFAGERTWLDRLLRPIERGIYRICRIDSTREMQAYQVKIGTLDKEYPLEGLFDPSFYVKAAAGK